jgi:hypothetical protein
MSPPAVFVKKEYQTVPFGSKQKLKSSAQLPQFSDVAPIFVPLMVVFGQIIIASEHPSLVGCAKLFHAKTKRTIRIQFVYEKILLIFVVTNLVKFIERT